MVYIKGGYFEGKFYTGSTDKQEPEDLGWMYVPYRLYFAKKSPRWDNKGYGITRLYYLEKKKV